MLGAQLPKLFVNGSMHTVGYGHVLYHNWQSAALSGQTLCRGIQGRPCLYHCSCIDVADVHMPLFRMYIGPAGVHTHSCCCHVQVSGLS